MIIKIHEHKIGTIEREFSYGAGGAKFVLSKIIG
jgi:hypothetical protein